MIKRLATVVMLATGLPTHAAPPARHFNPDTESSRIDWTDLKERLGPVPDAGGKRFGAVLKNQTNGYWRLISEGYRRRAATDGVKLDIQAAQNESDPVRQLAIMENMVGGLYAALLVSPQSDSNLKPAIDDAMAAGVPLVNVDGAVVDDITHFVGAKNRDMGARVARWFIQHYPQGGSIAVIKGETSMFSTIQRTAGFLDTLKSSGGFEVAAIVSAQWDRQQANEKTLDILRKTPSLIGIYCNNDVMALGATDAVKARQLLGQVRVFGTDGIAEAYRSIKAGGMTGTVDMFPVLTGEIGLEVAERLSAGQTVPRVVVTPHKLVTYEDLTRYPGDADAARRMYLEQARAGQ